MTCKRIFTRKFYNGLRFITKHQTNLHFATFSQAWKREHSKLKKTMFGCLLQHWLFDLCKKIQYIKEKKNLNQVFSVHVAH